MVQIIKTLLYEELVERSSSEVFGTQTYWAVNKFVSETYKTNINNSRLDISFSLNYQLVYECSSKMIFLVHIRALKRGFK
jgi:hypothetical protein